MRRFDNHPDELISASLTGDLTDVERRELQAHLSTCQVCRETLEAFSQQRQLLAGLPVKAVPRDLGPRVRTGIDSGRFGAPWWRRPGGLLAGTASLATVAAAALLAAFFLTGGLKKPQVAASVPPSTSAVATPSPSVTSSPAETPEPTPTQAPLPLGMRPGDLVYPALSGPVDKPQFTIDNNRNGQHVAVSPPSGQPIAASLSPDGQWLAYIYLRGLSGANEVAAVHLSDGSVVDLGATEGSAPFTDRLAWSPDGRYLAFTKAPFDMATGQNTDPHGPGSTEVYLFDTTTQASSQISSSGNAYAAGWSPIADGRETLWISLAAQNPQSRAIRFPLNEPLKAVDTGEQAARADGVFMPLTSPDGKRAIFWRGTMKQAGGAWSFITSGLPYLTSSSSGGIPSFASADPLFSDITITGQSDTFATGDFGWGADSNTLAFWNGLWSGNHQPSGYPDEQVVYVGKATDSSLLTARSGIDLGLKDTDRIAGVALSPGGTQAAITVGHATPGDLASPSSTLLVVDLATRKSHEVAAGGTPAWNGPGGYFSPTGAQ
jgi:hypothetical protein